MCNTDCCAVLSCNLGLCKHLSCSYRSSHQKCSIEVGVLKNLTKFTGKKLCQSFFFNKAAGLRPATIFKKRFWHRYFPLNFVKFLRTPFLQNTPERLLLFLGHPVEKQIFFIDILQFACLNHQQRY